MREGLATSATLMVPCPWAGEAVEKFKGLDIGIHFTLTAEYSGCRWRPPTDSPGLRDDEGMMPRTAAECRAQIDQALAWGVDIGPFRNRVR